MFHSMIRKITYRCRYLKYKLKSIFLVQSKSQDLAINLVKLEMFNI